MIPLRHGRVALALHALREGPGPTLLCLHAVGGSARDFAEAARHWPGPVFALDFSGHGASGWLRGGGYLPELLAGDADAALAVISRDVRHWGSSGRMGSPQHSTSQRGTPSDASS